MIQKVLIEGLLKRVAKRWKIDKLEKLFLNVNNNYKSAEGKKSPYGDGKSAERILKLIKDGHVKGI